MSRTMPIDISKLVVEIEGRTPRFSDVQCLFVEAREAIIQNVDGEQERIFLGAGTQLMVVLPD